MARFHIFSSNLANWIPALSRCMLWWNFSLGRLYPTSKIMDIIKIIANHPKSNIELFIPQFELIWILQFYLPYANPTALTLFSIFSLNSDLLPGSFNAIFKLFRSWTPGYKGKNLRCLNIDSASLLYDHKLLSHNRSDLLLSLLGYFLNIGMFFTIKNFIKNFFLKIKFFRHSGMTLLNIFNRWYFKRRIFDVFRPSTTKKWLKNRLRNRNAYQFINLGHYFSFEYNRLWTVAEMNLQTEEIEFENQLVDILPTEIHWNINQQGSLWFIIYGL